jgi:kumamolisin
MTNFDQVAQEAGLLGITITVASGDSGSSDGVNDGQAHVDFPASCPHVLAVGGTQLMATNTAIQSEQVWNDGAQGGATGGGFSTVFTRPDWQGADVTNTNRGIPDLAGDADPDTGYNILVDGQQMIVGGTSAVAPLMAGLIVLLNQNLNRRLAFANPAFYSVEHLNCFRDITVGDNGAFSAGFGWDPCTGLGVPIGAQLLQALESATTTTQQGQVQTQAHKTEHAHAGSK